MAFWFVPKVCIDGSISLVAVIQSSFCKDGACAVSRGVALVLLLLVSGIVLMAMSAPSQAANGQIFVNKVRYGQHPDKTRVVLDLSQTSDFRAFAQAAPQGGGYAIVVDMLGASWRAEGGRPEKPLRGARFEGAVAGLEANVSRIVFEAAGPVLVKSAFIIPQSPTESARLVLDVIAVDEATFQKGKGRVHGTMNPPPSGGANAGAKGEAGKASSSLSSQGTGQRTGAAPVVPSSKPSLPFAGGKTAPIVTDKTEQQKKMDALIETQLGGAAQLGAANNANALPRPVPQAKTDMKLSALTGQGNVAREGAVPVPSRKADPQGIYTVVIDAGHGGIDPGATGGSIKEKDITLATAKTLKRLMEQTGRYKVRLTRETDVYLKLHQRVALARAAQADLFISIHADSINRRDVKGASIYTLSNQASDAQTEKLAARENRVDLISGVDLSVEDDEVANILIDLSMRETMNQSKFFANTVVNAMHGGNIRMLENPHRYAGFAVLKAPDIPSVLIEIGFVSNESEAKRLMSPAYQEQIGKAVMEGVGRYFETLEKNRNTQ